MEDYTKQLRKLLKPLFVKESVEGIKVIASTGKYSKELFIPTSSILSVNNFEDLAEKIKQKLHYELERKIFEDRYNSIQKNPQGKYFMVDIVAPEEYEIIVVNPKRYPILLREGRIKNE